MNCLWQMLAPWHHGKDEEIFTIYQSYVDWVIKRRSFQINIFYLSPIGANGRKRDLVKESYCFRNRNEIYNEMLLQIRSFICAAVCECLVRFQLVFLQEVFWQSKGVLLIKTPSSCPSSAGARLFWDPTVIACGAG